MTTVVLNSKPAAMSPPPAGVGDNAEDLHPRYAAEVEKLLRSADTWAGEDAKPIQSAAEAGILQAAIDQARAWEKKVEQARVDEKEPWLAGSRRVDEKWKPLKDRLAAVLASLKKPMTAWLRREEQRIAAEREAARKAAEEARAKADEEARKAAATGRASDKLRANQALDDAATAAANAHHAEAARPQVKGDLAVRAMGLRKRTVVDEIVDLKAAVLHYATEPKMMALVTELANRDLRAGATAIPGITVRNEEIAA